MLTTYSFDLELTLPILGPGSLQFGDIEAELEIGYSVDAGNLDWWIEKVRVRAYGSVEKRFIGYWRPRPQTNSPLDDNGSFNDVDRIIERTVDRHGDTRHTIKEAAWAHYRKANVDTRREDRAELLAQTEAVQ